MTSLPRGTANWIYTLQLKIVASANKFEFIMFNLRGFRRGMYVCLDSPKTHGFLKIIHMFFVVEIFYRLPYFAPPAIFSHFGFKTGACGEKELLGG